jgi:hypothetical protein
MAREINTRIKSPAESPSRPSEKFTALDAAIMKSTPKGIHKIPRSMVGFLKNGI